MYEGEKSCDLNVFPVVLSLKIYNNWLITRNSTSLPEKKDLKE
jgi:hypothetical protein